MEDNINVSQSVETVAAPVAESAPVQATGSVAQAQPIPSFVDGLSEDLRGAKSLSNFKDVNDLAKSYLNAQALIGKRIQDMGPEDLAHINHLRGVPQSPDAYSLPAELQPEAVDWYRKAAMEAGLSQEQARKLSENFIMNNRLAAEKQQQQIQLQHTNWINDLKQEFGSAFDQRIDIAKRAVDAFGGQELKQLLNETGLGNNPVVVKMFAKIGANILEDQLVRADYEKTAGMTPADAKAVMNNKMLDPEFRSALYSATHPAHAAAVSEYEKLISSMNFKG
jgi:hypothetical protein